MSRSTSQRRRPAIHVTLPRAARLYRLVATLTQGPRTRDELLSELGIGLRTFYRELELLKRCGIKVQLARKTYVVKSTPGEAEGRLPFPDPQLSFAEMSELARHPGEAALRLARLLESVTQPPPTPPGKPRAPKRARPKRNDETT